MGHHVAPVTRAVADGEQHRTVVAARAFEGPVSPGIPVHGVVRVLEQVRARLGGKAIGHEATLPEGLPPAPGLQPERRRGTNRVRPSSAAADATSVIAPIPSHFQTSCESGYAGGAGSIWSTCSQRPSEVPAYTAWRAESAESEETESGSPGPARIQSSPPS